MATAARKRSAEPLKDTDRSRVSSSWLENVEKIGELGEGLVLVQFNTKRVDKSATRYRAQAGAGTPSAPAIPSNVKRFTPQEIQSLLEEYSAAPVRPTSPSMKCASLAVSLKRKALNKNEQFVENLRAQELENRSRGMCQ